MLGATILVKCYQLYCNASLVPRVDIEDSKTSKEPCWDIKFFEAIIVRKVRTHISGNGYSLVDEVKK